jgi:diguanylate cyclase (GGDEF)-like protein
MAKWGLFDRGTNRAGASPKRVAPSRVHPLPDELPPPGLWDHLTGRERDATDPPVRPAPAVNRQRAPMPMPIPTPAPRPSFEVPDVPDPLTGLSGRRQFEREVQDHADRAGALSPGCALLFIALDHFGRINASLGRAGGDQVLAEVADRIRGCIRNVDRAAHLESDTFAVLLAGTTLADEAAGMARKIAAALGRPIEVGDEFVMVTASVGGALSDVDGRDAQMLMAAAEKALARAKRRGPRQVEINGARASAPARAAGHP